MIEHLVDNKECLNCKHLYLHYIKDDEWLKFTPCAWGHCKFKRTLIDLQKMPACSCVHRVECNHTDRGANAKETAYNLLVRMSQRLEKLIQYFASHEDTDAI